MAASLERLSARAQEELVYVHFWYFWFLSMQHMAEEHGVDRVMSVESQPPSEPKIRTERRL